MPDIVLATLNAKFIHAAFGLRYLFANLGDLQPRAAIAEFDLNQKPIEIAEAILAREPRVLGLGVYIWNVRPTAELVGILKRARPELVIVLGGPEVSYETAEQEIVGLADHVITGEADLKFAEVCRELLTSNAERGTRNAESGTEKPVSPGTGSRAPGLPKVIAAEVPDLNRLELPYDFYDARDVAHRVIYVEASRGCPFTCEFCLSSLDLPVRQFPLDRFLGAMRRLLDRGVTQFKFVDRTFNLHLPTSTAILRFFLERWRPGLFVHFEMVPDRLPEALRELIAQFPAGGLQFEVGVQTLNPEVEQLISRRQNQQRMEENFRWLRQHSGVHLHADLIAGLPGESLASFAAGFDRLRALGPQEIQVGILKRLRGTPIVRHDAAWAMRYSPQPPYEVLQTRLLDFATLARLRRFASFWDLYGNSGNFRETLPRLWAPGGGEADTFGEVLEPVSADVRVENEDGRAARPTVEVSPFWAFLAFSDWLHGRGVKTSGIALVRQFELLWDYLTSPGRQPREAVAAALEADYRRGGRSDVPPWLRAGESVSAAGKPRPLPKRQARHLESAPK